MKTAFFDDSTRTRYTFLFPDDGTGDQLTIVRTRPDDEQIALVKVRKVSGKTFTCKVSGSRVACVGGAYGLYKAIRQRIADGVGLFDLMVFASAFMPD